MDMAQRQVEHQDCRTERCSPEKPAKLDEPPQAGNQLGLLDGYQLVFQHRRHVMSPDRVYLRARECVATGFAAGMAAASIILRHSIVHLPLSNSGRNGGYTL